MPNPRKGTSKGTPFDMETHFAELTAAMRGRYAFLEEGLSDLQVVIMATALLDKFLSFYIAIGFNADAVSKTTMAETFEGNGPLSTFSAKIIVCNLIGYLVNTQHHDLKVLKSIRNDFAHSLRAKSLADVKACDNLHLRHPNRPVPKGDRRAAFISSAAQSVVYCAYGATALLARQQFLAEHRESERERGMKLAREMLLEPYPESAGLRPSRQPGD